MTIRVFLVDDQALVRAGFAMLLSAQPDMEVVGEAGDGAAAVAALSRTPIDGMPAGIPAAGMPADVVLMDVRMPVMDGVEATRRLMAMGPGAPRVLVLTTFDLDEYAFAALGAGASGFLLKDARPDDLLHAIRAVAAGDAVIAPSATRRLLDHFGPSLRWSVPHPAIRLLTGREKEVLVEVAHGATNAEIATTLFMAESTVKTHIGSLLAKLGCRDRVGLVLAAFASNLLHPGD